jgi:hypothetical protein
MRSRNIKPALFKNEVLGTEDPFLTILFEGLWCAADREGRLEDRPLRIKAEIFPYRHDLDINGYLTDLERLEFICRYQVGKQNIIQVIKFLDHQNPHKTEKASILPDVAERTNEIKELHDNVPLTVKEPLNNGRRPADSLLLIPDSLSLIPDSLIPDSFTLTQTSRGSRAPKINGEKPTTKTWESYSTAYIDRYGSPPLRNARVNAQIAQLLKRIPRDDAPLLAAWFVSHNGRWYVQKGHAIGMLLSDAEHLYTQWQSGRVLTEAEAREVDGRAKRGEVWNKLISEFRDSDNDTQLRQES